MRVTIGVDEVGRGAWAGPLLVVAARKRKQLPPGLQDSKVLTASKRNVLYPLIAESCDIGQGWVSNVEIDEIGLAAALRIAFLRAVDALVPGPEDYIVLDGKVNYCDKLYPRSKAQVKADGVVPIVSAASIYAKVLRDTYMQEQAQVLPGYGFAEHVGYGTQQHVQGLHHLGVSRLHRRSFRPIQAFLCDG